MPKVFSYPSVCVCVCLGATFVRCPFLEQKQTFRRRKASLMGNSNFLSLSYFIKTPFWLIKVHTKRGILCHLFGTRSPHISINYHLNVNIRLLLLFSLSHSLSFVLHSIAEVMFIKNLDPTLLFTLLLRALVIYNECFFFKVKCPRCSLTETTLSLTPEVDKWWKTNCNLINFFLITSSLHPWFIITNSLSLSPSPRSTFVVI